MSSTFEGRGRLNSFREEETNNKLSESVWSRLPKPVKGLIIATGAFVGSVVALSQLGKDAPSDAEILEWEKQHTKELMKEDSDRRKELQADKINPFFQANIGEAYEKFGKSLGLTKAAWDADSLITIRFVNAHPKYNAIDVFIGELKGTLEKKGLLDRFTPEMENELRIQLLSGSASTISYEEALKNLE